MTAILEATMLAAFSVSWYCSIWKMLATKRASGKSLGFVLLIVGGYVCGILSKLALYVDTGHLSALIALYSWNLLVTAFDAFLVWHFHRKPEEDGHPGLKNTIERAVVRRAPHEQSEKGTAPVPIV
jgi:hypothetical protein